MVPSGNNYFWPELKLENTNMQSYVTDQPVQFNLHSSCIRNLKRPKTDNTCLWTPCKGVAQKVENNLSFRKHT